MIDDSGNLGRFLLVYAKQVEQARDRDNHSVADAQDVDGELTARSEAVAGRRRDAQDRARSRHVGSNA
ncbi:hypothetical protein NJE57_16950 [Dietzia sp. PP-33]|nr:hypothetical protein [Dietzia sp. PP-33]